MSIDSIDVPGVLGMSTVFPVLTIRGVPMKQSLSLSALAAKLEANHAAMADYVATIARKT